MTSEGIFVFTGSTTPRTWQSATQLTVTGTVDEFYPDGRSRELGDALHDRADRCHVGRALQRQRRAPPSRWPDHRARRPTPARPAGASSPSRSSRRSYALDFFESREGMRVQVTDARVVGPTTPFNELFVTTKPTENPTVRGGTLYGGYDQQNSGRLLVQSLIPFAQRPFPQVNVGDSAAAHRRPGRLQPLRRLHDPGDRARHRGPTAGSSGRSPASSATTSSPIATYNVENLDPTDPADKFARLAQGIVTNLSSPDIVALEEIQDNNGADQRRHGRRRPDARHVHRSDRRGRRPAVPVAPDRPGRPRRRRRAGRQHPRRLPLQPGPGHLRRPSGGDADDAGRGRRRPERQATPVVSPGRIDPTSAAWNNSRKPLVGEFVFNDKTVFVVANHFNSKGGDQPLFGALPAADADRPRSSGSRRRPRCASSSARSRRSTATPTSSCSATSTTSSSHRRSPS